jgi:hypothetical protein
MRLIIICETCNSWDEIDTEYKTNLFEIEINNSKNSKKLTTLTRDLKIKCNHCGAEFYIKI